MRDELLQLVDIKRIHELKARYCRFIDTKQWDSLRSLFAADTTFEGFGSAPTGADVDVFIEGVSTRLEKCVSIHQCHMPEISFRSPTSARGIWAMMDYLQWPSEFAPNETPGHAGFFGYGHYEEEYRQVDGAWKFSFLRLTRLRIDALPVGAVDPSRNLLAASRLWLA